jgi:hypothetical protein
VNSVGSYRNRFEPVSASVFSPAAVHRVNGFCERKGAVFPVVHTPYDFYERI